jgi:hypothetical protein
MHRIITAILALIILLIVYDLHCESYIRGSPYVPGGPAVITGPQIASVIIDSPSMYLDMLKAKNYDNTGNEVDPVWTYD